MKPANEIYNNVVSKEKEQKYTSMMKHQEEIITRAIKDGDVHGSRLFVFSDRGYFYGVSKPWYEEFYYRAKRELEDAGYQVHGICVYW